MLTNIKAVFFDLDGTLIDSMHIWKDIDIAFLGRFGYDLPADLQKNIEGMAFKDTAVYFKTHFDIPLSLEEIMQTWNEMAFYKYTHEIGFKPGAIDFLKFLKKKNIPTAICTSNSKELATAVAKSLSITPYVNEIITSCEVGCGKPAPDIYLEAARRVGVDPKDCLVFEDVIAGITAGKRAGMKVCAMEDDFSKMTREEKKALADYYLEDYSVLMNE